MTFRSLNLWAVSRDHTSEFFAAPSYEAAVAACRLESDQPMPWTFYPGWHADDVLEFLSRWDVEGAVCH